MNSNEALKAKEKLIRSIDDVYGQGTGCSVLQLSAKISSHRPYGGDVALLNYLTRADTRFKELLMRAELQSKLFWKENPDLELD